MPKMKFVVAALSTLLMAAPAFSAEHILRWSSQGDSLTMDPHAQNEGQTLTMNQQMYEPLIERAPDMAKFPALAVSWKLVEPKIWEFKLRENVKFHEGQAFTADDVVFSYKRALSDTSDYKEIINAIEDVVKVDDVTVRIHTKGPDPILPDEITNIYIMSKTWAEQHNVLTPQDIAKGQETYAVRHTNGTGPFKLDLREPDVRTVMVKNPDWWGHAEIAKRGEPPLNVDRIVYTPISNAATRIAALLSGELDLVIDPPIQDIARIESAPTLKTQRVPETRAIFLGMNGGLKELTSSSVKGKNPFADIRVRKALNMAVNEDAIASRIMRGMAQPAGHVIPPGLHGYDPELDKRMPFDAEGAKKLLAEAGYPNGFDVRLDCPNDRYLNDEEICQAVVSMLARVGVKVTLDLKPRTLHFPKMQNGTTEFYLLGWGTPTLDIHYHLVFLGLTDSVWNRTGYVDQRMFDLINQGGLETDLAKRDAMLAEASKILKNAVTYIPLHHQLLVWASRKEWNVPIVADNQPIFSFARYVGP